MIFIPVKDEVDILFDLFFLERRSWTSENQSAVCNVVRISANA